MSLTTNFTEDDMMERLLALLLAGALVAPQISLASASELNNNGPRQAASKFPEKLPLPPIPYLDTMPWMSFGLESKGPGIDTLLLRDFQVPASPKHSAFANNSSWNAGPQLGRTAAR
jgi:hypothetical protein